MILAAAEPWVDFLVNSGPIGVILVMAALGWVHFKPAMDQCLRVNEQVRQDLLAAREDLRAARDELRTQEKLTREIVIPAVTEASVIIKNLSEQLLWRRGAA